jgi:beta-galactosidase
MAAPRREDQMTSLYALLLLLLTQLPAGSCSSSSVLLLDGEDWHLSLDPANPATKRIAAAGNKTDGAVTVPGAWQAQGFGEDIERMRHQYIGVATYTKTIDVPAAMTDDAMSLWLVAEDVHRSAELLIAGTKVTEHEGYLTRLEGNVSAHVPRGGGSLAITLAVNSTKNDGHDGLRGTNDFLDFGETGWGGINGHVWLESRAAAWIVDPHVQFELSPAYDAATLNVTVAVETAATAQQSPHSLSLEVSYLDAANHTLANVSKACTPPVCIGGQSTLQSPALWSPTSPVLHTAIIVLRDDSSGKVLSSKRVRFGLRQIEIAGGHFKLNGVYLYLHGYGDDSVYPDTVAPPTTKSVYAKRLALVKRLGFNFVRCHSHILPDEYFEAAAEAGVLVSAEFPMIYVSAMHHSTVVVN